MASPPQTRPLIAAVLEVLTAGDLVADLGEKPAGAGWASAPGTSAFTPYAVVHDLGGPVDGTLAEPSDDGWHRFQVTGVGSTAEQAQWAGDRARTLLTGAVLTVAGRAPAVVDLDEMGACRRDEDVQPVVWFTSDVFTAMTTPAPEEAP